MKDQIRVLSVDDQLGIESLDRIPSFQAFQKLGKAMSAAAGQNTAA